MKKLFFFSDKAQPNSLFCDWCIDEYKKKDILYPKYKDLDFTKTNKYLSKYQKNFNSEIFKILNSIHKKNYSLRHWNILLGRWSKFFLQSIFFRFNYLNTVVKENKINELYFCFDEKKIFKPNSLFEMITMLNNEDYNNYLLYKISQILFKKKKIKLIIKKKKNFFKNENQKILLNLKQIFLNKINFFLRFLIPKNSPIIINTYFPKLIEFKMMIRYNTLFFWNNFFLKKNNELISKLKKIPISQNNQNYTFDKKNSKQFDKIVSYFYLKLIPQCYLEHYTFCKNFINKNLIVKPKFIFSSNNFIYDEFFKVFLTENILKNGTKYYAGQHGSAYGLFKTQSYTIEEQTSDKFLTWGWRYKKNHLPTFLFKTYKKKKKFNLSKLENIIIVTDHFPYKIELYNSKKLFLEHLNKLVNLVNRFKGNESLNFEFKIHHADKKYKKFYQKYFEKKLTNKKYSFTFTKENTLDYLSDNSLVIFSYFSTGFLEFLSLGLPCLCFSNYRYNMFDNRCLKYLKILEKNKYLYFDEIKIFKQIKLLYSINNLNYFFKIKNKKIIEFKNKYSNNQVSRIDRIFKLF